VIVMSERDALARRDRVWPRDSSGRYFTTTTGDGPVQFVVQPESGRKLAAVKVFSSLFRGDSDVLVLLKEFSLFADWEDMNLFDGFRASRGVRSGLTDSPGHLFASSDDPDFASILNMALFFEWGAVITSDAGEICLDVSHDMVVNVYLARRETRERLIGSMAPILRGPVNGTG
jgi:hypothetical protein